MKDKKDQLTTKGNTMSRTPSFERSEVEAILGARGNLIVTTNNRAEVRKWLGACGVAAAHYNTLSHSSLAYAYNDTSDQILAEHLRISGKPAVAPANGNEKDSGKALLTAFEQFLNEKGKAETSAPLDTAAVRALIAEELAKQPSTKLEIKIADKVVFNGSAPRHEVFAEVLTAVANGQNVMLVGPAGSGKTTLAKQVAEALGSKFYLQGAVSGAHEYLGFVDAQGKYQSTPFRQAFEFGGTILVDEIDGSDPGATLVINSATANGEQAFPDRTEPVAKHPDFRLLCAANTFGNGADRQYVGRNQLDAATLDRFYFIDMNYDETLERTLCGNETWAKRVQAIRKAVAQEKVRLIVSPRASINGAKMLAAGADQAKVEKALIWKGIDADTKRRVEARCI